MKWTRLRNGCAGWLLIFAVKPVLWADVALPAIFSDHAILQRSAATWIWGKADPGESIDVAVGGVSSVSTADRAGRWRQALDLSSTGAGPFDLVVTGRNRLVIHDVTIGEVWLAAGQSNMEYDIAAHHRADLTNPAEVAEIAENVAVAQREAAAAEPKIRYFRVATRGLDEPADDVRGRWAVANPGNVANASAVAWNFVVALQAKLHRGIGFIDCSVGNTPIQAWMSRQTLSATTIGAEVYRRNDRALAATTPEMVARYRQANQDWLAANPTGLLQLQHQSSRPVPPYLNTANAVPNRFYNGMVRGIEPYAVRGIIWFQGDSNMDHPQEYSEMFQALIKEWRGEWLEPRMPFYFVETNSYPGPKQARPVEPNPISLIREAQHGGLLQPAVGMVCSIDLGSSTNAHFPRKKPVGERLAGLALRDCYGQPGALVNSPLYQSFALEGKRIRLTFSDATGLRTRGAGPLQGFAIRSREGAWVWAEGRIEGRAIALWSEQVPAPAAARYAWAKNPLISVENAAGLPLAPFRTDPDRSQ